jgi:hypothetical protein
MPYFYEKREIFMFASTKDFWGMPLDGFLHEGLHFQFTYYWYENPKSEISKLDFDKFDYLKEALTIVLDDELKPLISIADKGYANQAGFRKALHAKWKKSHDFDELVDFGLKELPKFFGTI